MTMQKIFKSIPIEALQAGRYQPRQQFDKQALEELAASIATQGLIEPLVVRALSGNHYEIIAGERRWRAAMLVGLSELPCLISDYSDEQAAAITLIENIQRQDLNLMEEASGYQRLQQEFHFQQDEIATLVGKSRSHIANLLRLLTLCDAVQAQIRQEQLSLGHARMLVGLPSHQQVSLAQAIKKNGWSVRQLEQQVRLLKATERATPSQSTNADVERLQNQIADYIGSPVQIDSEANQGGWLKIKFFDNETLAGLLERMGMSNVQDV